MQTQVGSLKDKFSLLRIKPEVIWDNIDDRPELFAGTICVVEKENEAGKNIRNTVNEVQDTVPINEREYRRAYFKFTRKKYRTSIVESISKS